MGEQNSKETTTTEKISVTYSMRDRKENIKDIPEIEGMFKLLKFINNQDNDEGTTLSVNVNVNNTNPNGEIECNKLKEICEQVKSPDLLYDGTPQNPLFKCSTIFYSRASKFPNENILK